MASKSFEEIPNFIGVEAGKAFREAVNARLKELYDRIAKLEEEVVNLRAGATQDRKT